MSRVSAFFPILYFDRGYNLEYNITAAMCLYGLCDIIQNKGPAQPTRQVCSIRYQDELLGLWDPQNRDLRRKLPPETMFSVG